MKSLNLELADVAKSVEVNKSIRVGSVPTYTVPLPKSEHNGERIHVGSIVRSVNNAGVPYVLVSFADDDWAVVVPIGSPECAYTVRLDRLRVIPVTDEACELILADACNAGEGE